ncbi:MAG: hypothetical protein COX57_06770 [Alphaproteobacteria bacterium CG_4_10_14_0_2_um_filter_63_37]|nr:MAG: hypothetical protein AUJ55_11575 [Proteobacteria bacterium CG1_02_64_396]PJA24788.1 MAG: hypothetical protein COX57_06770 [Alphaproteobacteria bacterium CG_4_10_14_0_2_um_filter_63_37]
MDIQIRYIERLSGGAATTQIEERRADRLTLGRGTDNEIFLPDPRVPLEAAVLTPQGEGWLLESVGGTLIRVNGEVVGSAVLGLGDCFSLGPYDMALMGQMGRDLALEVEFVRPLGEHLDTLMNEGGVGSEALQIRPWRWGWLVLGLVLLLAGWIPYHSYQTALPPSGQAGFKAPDASTFWRPGSVQGQHRHFGDACQTCHTAPFTPVADVACLKCHDEARPHLTQSTASKFGQPTQRCGVCHQEHQPATNARMWAKQEDCLACHGSPTMGKLPGTPRPVHGFPTGHPPLHALVAGFDDEGAPVVRRQEVPDLPDSAAIAAAEDDNALRALWKQVQSQSAVPIPEEDGGLFFTHKLHLKAEGIAAPEGKRVLNCASCHTPDVGKVGFKPVTMAANCIECHVLTLDGTPKGQALPHTDPVTLRQAIGGYFAQRAVQGRFDVPDPETGAVAPPPQGAQAVQAWVKSQTEDAEWRLFGAGACKKCHGVGYPDEEGGLFTVAPVHLQNRFMPEAAFSHRPHQTQSCTTCHMAKVSGENYDLLMPGLSTCATCHGSEGQPDRLATPCTGCHHYHGGDEHDSVAAALAGDASP